MPAKSLIRCGIHRLWLLRLRENLKQLVIRQEVEARERHSFRLQVIVRLFWTVCNNFLLSRNISRTPGAVVHSTFGSSQFSS